MKYSVWIIIHIVGYLKYTYGQFSLGTSKTTKNSCDISKTALVEQFFNVIFSEFQNTPPLCTCVQMCPDQPTYCYPTGCLRRPLEVKVDKPTTIPVPTRPPKVNVKAPIFYVDEKNGLMGGFVENPRHDNNMEGQMQASHKSLRPDPFIDRYKLYFKNKKSPKVELKYHHGEQVKNLKSDLRNDVANSRWPLNKNRRTSQRIYLDHQKVKSLLAENSNLHTPKAQKDLTSKNSMKYFKRELNNLTNGDNEVDKEVVDDYVSAKNQNAIKNIFSLESLLMFIENKLEPLIGITKELNNYENVTDKNISDVKETDTFRNLTASHNESTQIISMNFTIENVDKNVYIEEDKIKSQSSGDPDIATTDKSENAISLEFVQKFTETIIPSEKNTEPIVETTPITTTEKSSEKFILPIGTEHKMTTKSQQRITRNLYQRKNN